MPCYEVANLVTVTKTNMIDEMPCAYGTLRTSALRIRHEVSRRAAQRSQLLQNWTILLVKSRSILRMLLQSLGAFCKAPGGPGSIWKYLEAMVKATGVSGRFACGFWTDLHFSNVTNEPIPTYGHSWPQRHCVRLQ